MTPAMPYIQVACTHTGQMWQNANSCSSSGNLWVFTALFFQLFCMLEHIHNLKVGRSPAQNSLFTGFLLHSLHPTGLTCCLVPCPRFLSCAVRARWPFSPRVRVLREHTVVGGGRGLRPEAQA